MDCLLSTVLRENKFNKRLMKGGELIVTLELLIKLSIRCKFEISKFAGIISFLFFIVSVKDLTNLSELIIEFNPILS